RIFDDQGGRYLDDQDARARARPFEDPSERHRAWLRRHAARERYLEERRAGQVSRGPNAPRALRHARRDRRRRALPRERRRELLDWTYSGNRRRFDTWLVRAAAPRRASSLERAGKQRWRLVRRSRANIA